MSTCIFCQIASGEIPKDFVYQDQHVMVFPDLAPSAPIHLLIVPKEHIPDVEQLKQPELLMHIFTIAKKVSATHGGPAGYRLAVNSRDLADVGHVHFHLWSGQTKDHVFEGGDTR